MAKEFFYTLELPETASWEEVRTSYRILIQVWHPDRFQNPSVKAKAEEKTRKINNAFSELKSHFKATESGQAHPGTKSSADSEAESYVDEARYLGGDARVVPSKSGLLGLGRGGQPCAVVVSPFGIMLLMLSSSGEVEAEVRYPASDVQVIQHNNEIFKLADHDFVDPQQFKRPSEGEVVLQCRDPEAIIRKGFIISLGFQTPYLSALFTKRCVQFFNLQANQEKPSPPKPHTPPPPVKTSVQNEVMEQDNPEAVDVGQRGFFIGLLVLLFSLIVLCIGIAIGEKIRTGGRNNIEPEGVQDRLARQSTPEIKHSEESKGSLPLSEVEVKPLDLNVSPPEKQALPISTRSRPVGEHPRPKSLDDVLKDDPSIPDHAILESGFVIWVEPEYPKYRKPYNVYVQVVGGYSPIESPYEDFYGEMVNSSGGARPLSIISKRFDAKRNRFTISPASTFTGSETLRFRSRCLVKGAEVKIEFTSLPSE